MLGILKFSRFQRTSCGFCCFFETGHKTVLQTRFGPTSCNQMEIHEPERRESDLIQRLTYQLEEAQQHMATLEEGRARAVAEALQAADRAQAAEVLHPAPREA